MNFTLKPIAVAILVATTQLTGVANAQAPEPLSESVALPALTATNTPIPVKAPEAWIIYDDITYTPVVDAVSRHLDAARKAFDAKDNKKAAAEMHAVANELKLQAARADKEGRSQVDADKAIMAADTKFAQDIAKRMNASALKVSSAAKAIESGKITKRADLDKAIDKATRADMEHRWLLADVTTWYPVSEEPQRHFTNAVEAYAKKDYKAAAADIHKATSYLRLEAGRAIGETKQELESSVVQLDTLAASVEKGAVKEVQSITNVFAKANHALALEHRSKAVESWLRKEYNKTGYELKAAAHGLESAAGWVGGEVKAGASATVADTRALGDKLASGATWTRDEVAKGFESLGNSINALGDKIGSTKKASPAGL
ncbi:hypothetical protein W01_04950 [Candidatus Nitrotoga sp. AM1P]|nr:hypothetical protein W01_04950 [Candidatus Nitrotoga sp. AM1P]